MTNLIKTLKQYPLAVSSCALLGIVAFIAAVPMVTAGMWDAALVDLCMAAILIVLLWKRFPVAFAKESGRWEKWAAYLTLILADVLVILPTHNFAGGLLMALAFALLICAFVLYFCGRWGALYILFPAVWCCVFMPYHEEIMLLLSFPLRLSASFLSAGILNLCGSEIVCSGTSLTLPGVDIAITDACSGIRQLDAFVLIAFLAVQLLHRKIGWKMLHFAFIMPSIIVGNTMRIVLTVWLYRLWGECVFQNTWHTVLGYGQILFAVLIFLAIGSIFCMADKKMQEDEA